MPNARFYVRNHFATAGWTRRAGSGLRPLAREIAFRGEAGKVVHEFISEGGKLPVCARWIEGART